MTIVDVKTHVVSTPWHSLTFVWVLTDEGLKGLSEVRMISHTDAFLGYLAEAVPNHVVGHGPTQIEVLAYRLYRDDYMRPGQFQMSAIAALKVTCWDIQGKSPGQPVCTLLGGVVHDRIKAYANGFIGSSARQRSSMRPLVPSSSAGTARSSATPSGSATCGNG